MAGDSESELTIRPSPLNCLVKLQRQARVEEEHLRTVFVTVGARCTSQYLPLSCRPSYRGDLPGHSSLRGTA